MAGEKLTIKKSGSYDTKTGNYSIKDGKTGATITGSGSQSDYEKAYNSYGSSSGGSSSRSSSSGSSGSSISSYIKKLSDASLAAKTAQIEKAKNEAISGYNQQISAAPQTYQPLRNEADLRWAKNLQSIKENMAAGGKWRSGENVSAQTANNASTANAIAGYNQQETDFVNKLKTAIEQVKTNAGYDTTTALNEAEAQRLQALISQANADRNFNLSEAGLTGNYNGNQTLAAQAQALQKAIQEAQLTGSYNGVQTMQGATNELQNQGLSLQNAYQSLVNQNYPAQQALAMAQAQASLTGTNLQNDYQKLVNAGYPEQQALAIAQAKANIAQTQKQTSLLGVKSGSSGSSSANLSALKYANELGSQQALAQSMQGLQNMANDGATRSEILKFINANAGDLQANGVPIQDLYSWASKNFTWDKNSDGWYNTADE